MNHNTTAQERIATVRAIGGTTLDLSHCGLTAIPEAVFELEHLEVLILGQNIDPTQPQQNQITALPIDFIFLKSLRGLGLNGNQLTEYPTVLTHLKSLETLILSGNPIRRLSGEINQLSQLHTLGLEHCQLETLPDEIGDLSLLHTLSLSFNQLSELPHSFKRLVNLRKLGLAHNAFTAFPLALCTLPALQVINLAHNHLSSLPPAVHQLTHLQQLKLAQNPIPLDLIRAAERGHHALHQWAAERAGQRRAQAQHLLDAKPDPHEQRLIKAAPLLRFLTPHQIVCLLCDGKKKLSGRFSALNLQLDRATCFGCQGKGTVSGDASDLHRLLNRCIQRRLHRKTQLNTLLQEEANLTRKLEHNRHTQILFAALRQSLAATLQQKQLQIEHLIYQYQGYQRYERKLLQALYNYHLQLQLQQEQETQDAYDWTLQSAMPDLYLFANALERLLDEWEALMGHQPRDTARLHQLDTRLDAL